jgi:hypothetical protein
MGKIFFIIIKIVKQKGYEKLKCFLSGILFSPTFFVIIPPTYMTLFQFVLFFLSFVFIFFAGKEKYLKNEMILQVLRIA